MTKKAGKFDNEKSPFTGFLNEIFKGKYGEFNLTIFILILIIIFLFWHFKRKRKSDTSSSQQDKNTEKNLNRSSTKNDTKDIIPSKKHSILWSLFHISKLNSAIFNLSNEVEELNSTNLELKKKADTKLTLQQMKPIELDDTIKKKEAELAGLERDIDHLNLEISFDDRISNKKKELSDLENKIKDLDNDISNKNNDVTNLNSKLKNLNDQIIDVSERLEYEDTGLYEPKYEFANSSAFKGKLSEIRAKQKSMIKNETAAIIFTQLSFNDSFAKGKKMQKKNIKQILRSFNGECEAAINKVTKSNIETIEKRINRSFEQLNKLNESNGIRITVEYLDSKLNEAHLALDHALKKEEEKELLREQREREREEKQLQRQLAKEKAKYEKDAIHFEQAQDLVKNKIQKSTSEVEIESLKQELSKLQKKIDDINEKKIKLSDRAESPTAGYVYIISNIGSFGKRVFKIGVTRRLDPMDRINELSSASVPFKFDVHALIFSEDAYSLETELHNYFDKKRVNKINKRKEFFKLNIDEIKEVLNKHRELTFDFHEVPAAPEYRETLLLENKQLPEATK